MPPGIDKGEEDTGGDAEANGLGEAEDNIEAEKPPAKGPKEGELTADGIKRVCLLAIAAIADSFAANIER